MTGIPTKHKGRQFRSRLEARWANFFDLVGWRFEYEPFDLKGWIPDFVLFGVKEILVEIKPVATFPVDVAAEIAKSGWRGETLVLGCTIPVAYRDPRIKAIDPQCFGWLAEACDGDTCQSGSDRCVCLEPTFWWAEAILGRWEDGAGKLGFCHSCGQFRDRISGGYDGGHPGDGLIKPDEIAHLWTEAGNRVQWKPPA